MAKNKNIVQDNYQALSVGDISAAFLGAVCARLEVQRCEIRFIQPAQRYARR